MPKNQPEFELQCAVAEYLRRQYPNVMFLSDVRASLKLTIPQQVRQKKLQADNFAMPDMVIFKPKRGPVFPYHGLFLEFKAETPFKKDGTLKKNAHLKNQMAAVVSLRDLNYVAGFVWDFEMAKDLIDTYLQ